MQRFAWTKYFSLTILLCGGALVAQFSPNEQVEIRDSLLQALETAQGRDLASVYVNLAGNGAVSDSMAGVYAEKIIALSDSIGYPTGQIRGNYLLGHLAFGEQEFLVARQYYQAGLNLAQEAQLSDEILKGWSYLPDTYYNLKWFDSILPILQEYRAAAIAYGDSVRLGDSYLRDGNYFRSINLSKQAMAADIKAVEVFMALKDSLSLGDAYANLAFSLTRERENEQAIQYYLASLELYQGIDHPKGKMASLINFSICEKKLGRIVQADSLLKVALAVLEDAKERLRIGTYYAEVYEIGIKTNQADLRIEENQYLRAIQILDTILTQKSDYLELPTRGSVYELLAQAHLGLGRREEARNWAERSLQDFRQLNYMEEIREVLPTLVTISADFGNFQAAYQYQQELRQVSDSLNSLQRRREYQYLLLDYEKEVDQRKIAELEQVRLRSQNRQNLLVALLVLVLAVIASLVIFFRFRQRQNLTLLTQERKLDQMKTRFFTQISHELRTPLTLILGPLEQILESREETKQGKKLHLMRRNANRLLELVNQVLDLAKLKEGHLTLEARPTDIVQWSRIIFSSFHSKAEIKQLDYQIHTPEQEILIYLDREKYQQILSNLLSNGLKFTPEGGSLQLKIKDEPERVILEVRDSGPGLTEEEITQIFEAFYQASTAGNGPFEAGTGIGLALVKELVDLHGGSIEVKSDLGHGATFTLTFPKGTKHLPAAFLASTRLEATSMAEKLDLKEVKEIDSPSDLEKGAELPLILMAEDIPDMQDYLRSVLSDSYRLLIASDGAEAYQLAQIHTPDLVIADIMMPKMDGMEFVGLLKNNDQTDHIPVIFLSAKSSMEDRLEGWRKEAFAFLSKPFNPRELLLVVESALKMQKRLQARFQGEVILKPAEVAVSSRESRFLSKLTEFLEQNLDNSELSVEMLAEEMALSRSQFNRKLKALTGLNPTLFLRNFRLQKAKQLLVANFGNVSEVSDAVGISSPAYFSRIFSEAFGVSPTDFQKKHSATS